MLDTAVYLDKLALFGRILRQEGMFISPAETEDACRMIPGFKVKAVDTTAAGDSFNAGLAVGLAEGMDIDSAIRLANATGALSTTKLGAQPAMPTREQAQALMDEQA